MNTNGFEPIKKVSIVVSHGSLEGIEATLFFTFFGLDAIIDKRMDKVKVATVGNPGMHLPTLLGAIPGMSAFATNKMKKEIEKLDIPPIREFMTMIHDAG